MCSNINLPSDLLAAVAVPGGGRVSLVIGSGCSFEHPTSIPMSREYSQKIFQQLIADGVLQDGDCADPSDLSCLADTVFLRKGSQRELVERLRDHFNLRLAAPNEGYLILSALLCEGVVNSVVTLNYDLALSTAIAFLGVGDKVGVIECPEQLPQQKANNLYYLHRNANSPDLESWVLRSSALQQEWKGHWEPIIANKVLTAPIVVFAGLGTPIAVLIESVNLLRKSVPNCTKLYQVDPAEKKDSLFFNQLQLEDTAYIRCGWCEFMEKISQRLVIEHIAMLNDVTAQRIIAEKLASEDISAMLERFNSFGLVKLGNLRSKWILYNHPYCPHGSFVVDWIADLLLSLAMISRISGAIPVILESGLVEFYRDGRIVAVYIVVTGRGSRGRASIEAQLNMQLRQYRSHSVPPCGALISGTSDSWNTINNLPGDIIRGDQDEDRITGTNSLRIIHVGELNSNPNRIGEVVP